MPTGYTAKLYEGKPQSFAEFVMSCARGFGALITMRDEPLDAPIPDEFLPSPYHDDALREAEERLAELRTWTIERAEEEAARAYADAHRSFLERTNERRALRERYEAMLAEVDAWVPPTGDHIELRQFMRDQLKKSIEFDCFAPDAPTRLDGEAFLATQIARAEWDVEYHTKGAAEERERAAQRTAWVRQLRDSLSASEVVG